MRARMWSLHLRVSERSKRPVLVERAVGEANVGGALCDIAAPETE